MDRLWGVMKSQHRLLLTVALLGSSAHVRSDDWLVLENLNLIDGTGAAAREVEAMTVRQGKIESIGGLREPASKPLDRVTRIDLAGAWVMPGLVDTHVHVARFPDTMRQAREILESGLRGGVTSVRDMGGDARTLAEIQRALLNREWAGPTVAYAGMYGGPGLFEDDRIAELSPGYAAGESPWTFAVTAQTDLPLAVAASRGAGVSGIKIYGNLESTLAASTIAEASRQGLMSWAHATVFPAAPMELVEAGVNSLSHAPYLIWAAVDDVPSDYGARTAGPWDDIPPSHPRLQELYAAMAARGVTLDATLYVYAAMQKIVPAGQADWAPKALEWGAQAVQAALATGVMVTTGTDWFEPDPGGLPHTHDELVLLVERAGLTPMQAIVAGTHNGARAMGVLAQRGTLEVGKTADLLILENNPLEDIRNTQSIRMVIKNGVVVQP